MDTKIKATVISSEDLNRTVTRLAHQIVEYNSGAEKLALVGIRTRGATLAERLVKKIEEIEQKKVPLGILDITLYRDDFKKRFKQPNIQLTDLSFQIDDIPVVLVDDVLYTGRTARAALDALMDYGRPSNIQLAVLIDRGHRELPIQPDFIGKVVTTQVGEEIKVNLEEIDGQNCVHLIQVSENM
ncbi:MAG: bifunctional pyr operon transcriptional regulator/uracil phosphoribosyltransferase PyrR [candidate division KSB1 bacterium]|nr:bifunctional pyr operon transcriptional regulator/uracil phosphoribosyltransferase PyrR [candidate division KSB1 bacterium]